MRRAIVEDTQHLLTNSSLDTMPKETDINIHEARLAACYDLAYRMNHPRIYRLAKTPVLVSDATLTFFGYLNPQDRIQDIAQISFKMD